MTITLLNADGFVFGAVLTAVQACLMRLTLPELEYDAGGIVADGIGGVGVEPHTNNNPLFMESGEEIVLQFDVNRLRIIPASACAAVDIDADVAVEKKKKKALPLKEIVVYVPFLLYKSLQDPEEAVLLCDASAEVSAVLRNNLRPGGGDYCEAIVGANQRFHALTLSTGGGVESALIDEIVTIAHRRYTAVAGALARGLKN